ncbi:MAG TPA: DUF2156 domain-containing protein [Planctomycetaceae bacterium]|nr:DUF2156 domain-containing protein [Planctomycetaceae bacterium]
MREPEFAPGALASSNAIAVHPSAPVAGLHDGSQALVQEFAYRYGESYDSYLATDPARTLFWSSAQQGLVSYRLQGRHALVGGGLLAAAEHKRQLLHEFVDFASHTGLRIVFHNICDHDLPLFRSFGFQVTKWGEEPIVDLEGCTWSGKAYEWVRRQTNFCLRQGVQAFEVHPDGMSEPEWSRTFTEVLEVAQQSLATKPQSGEMEFYDGSLAEHPLGLRRLFIARSEEGAGRIEGFVVCNPMLNGNCWAAEIYRHRLDSVRGTVPFLIHHILKQLQSEGVENLSLCLIPAQGCKTPTTGDSVLLRYGLQLMEHGFNWVFDIAGMRHFKTRFRPRFEDRYMCALPDVSLGSIVAMLGAFGALRLDYGKVARILLGRMRKRAARATLAQV